MYTKGFIKKSKIVVTMAVISALLLGGTAVTPNITHANATEISEQIIQTKKNELKIVVLGDSLAAGYEYGFTESSIPYGFADHIYEQALFQGYRATYSNYGVLGLRSDGLGRWLEAAKSKTFISPNEVQHALVDPRKESIIGDTTKISQDLAAADLIVLAIGGNDFLALLKEIDLNKQFSSYSKDEKEKISSQLQEVIHNYSKQLSEILSIIQSINPDVQIVTQNQYLPLPFLIINGKEKSFTKVDSELAWYLVDIQEELNATFEQVIKDFQAKNLNIVAVDAAKTIESNIFSHTGIIYQDVHPSSQGYKMLGKAYSELLWGQFKEVTKRKEGTPVSVVVNGNEINSVHAPILKDGRTFLVLKDITDAMGAKLEWNNISKTAIISLGDSTVELTIGSKQYKVNGQIHTLNSDPAFLQNNKTYLPLSALSQGLGFHVVFRDKQKIVFVNQ